MSVIVNRTRVKLVLDLEKSCESGDWNKWQMHPLETDIELLVDSSWIT